MGARAVDALQFRLLGPLEVVDGDRPIALGGRKQRSLLAMLLLHANDVVSTELLVDEIWGGSPPATVAKSVQIYVSRLRKALGDGRLVTRAPGYLLRVAASELDLTRFQALVAEAGGADPQGVSYQLAQVLRRAGRAADRPTAGPRTPTMGPVGFGTPWRGMIEHMFAICNQR
jgi:DNA-binding SARP family transcriptional activator